MFAGVIHTVKCIKEVIMQEFDHTSRDDRTYTEEERSCPYFDECYIQVRNQGLCRYMCQDNPAYRKESK